MNTLYCLDSQNNAFFAGYKVKHILTGAIGLVINCYCDIYKDGRCTGCVIKWDDSGNSTTVTPHKLLTLTKR